MYVIKNIKYNNYYKLKINSKTYHFVLLIDEAKRLTKTNANEILNNFKCKENYMLVKVK